VAALNQVAQAARRKAGNRLRLSGYGIRQGKHCELGNEKLLLLHRVQGSNNDWESE
jgi:hypothetical protein